MKRTSLAAALLLFAHNASAERQSTQDYIKRWKTTAVEHMHTFNIPASITLAQGILESGSGNSDLAVQANNHFGIKCHRGWQGEHFYQDDDAENECFRKYKDAAESYTDHALFLTSRSRYAGLFELRTTDYKGWSKGLKSAGYATNPKYADLLIGLIERYRLYEYDKGTALPPQKEEKEEARAIAEQPPAPALETPAVLPTNFTAAIDKPSTIEIHTSSRTIAVNQYKARYVKARKGDTYYRLAKELRIALWQLHWYNDLGKRDVLKEGEIIYIDPKRNRASTKEGHWQCREPMTMSAISQLSGIKLKKLLRYNTAYAADQVVPRGTTVYLR